MSQRIGIIGATGAVGKEVIGLLEKREAPCTEVNFFASERSAGTVIRYKGKDVVVQAVGKDIFKDLDICIFCANGTLLKELAPEAVKSNCVVIDNSSAYRMDPLVPLVVPEINSEALKEHKGIIANPNCSTAISLMGLYPLHKAFGLKRFFATTYQAVSGSGVGALRELEDQTRAWVNNEELEASVYPHPIAFNLIPHVDSFLEDGYTKEELKMANESRKILGEKSLKVSATCVRVPVLRAHSIAINAEFERPVDRDLAIEAIEAFSGIEMCDVPESNTYPMPISYSKKEVCGLGRLRIDSGFENGLAFWIVGDQLWKGAALNAVQILEGVLRLIA